MLKIVMLLAAVLAFASAKPKPLVVEYPAYEYAAYTAPVSYSYGTHYDYHDHALPYAAYSYEYAPYSYYEYLRR